MSSILVIRIAAGPANRITGRTLHPSRAEGWLSLACEASEASWSRSAFHLSQLQTSSSLTLVREASNMVLRRTGPVTFI